MHQCMYSKWCKIAGERTEKAFRILPVNLLNELSRQISCSPVVLMSIACSPSELEASITKAAWPGPFTTKLMSRSPPSITLKDNVYHKRWLNHWTLQSQSIHTLYHNICIHLCRVGDADVIVHHNVKRTQ